jgi:hypothetical protein
MLVFGPHQDYDIDVHVIWRPLLELTSPVLERGFGYDDQMWSGNVSMVLEISEEGNGLEGLAKTLREVL